MELKEEEEGIFGIEDTIQIQKPREAVHGLPKEDSVWLSLAFCPLAIGPRIHVLLDSDNNGQH